MRERYITCIETDDMVNNLYENYVLLMKELRRWKRGWVLSLKKDDWCLEWRDIVRSTCMCKLYICMMDTASQIWPQLLWLVIVSAANLTIETYQFSGNHESNPLKWRTAYQLGTCWLSTGYLQFHIFIIECTMHVQRTAKLEFSKNCMKPDNFWKEHHITSVWYSISKEHQMILHI